MRATIEGTSWQSGAGALTSPVQTAGPGGYTITGSSQPGASARTIFLWLMNIPGPGTYPLGTGGNVSGGSAIVSDATGGWGTPLSGAAGSISITTLTDSRFVATFFFTAEASSGSATGTRTVTAGSVDLPISIVAPPGPVANRSRNRVQATLNGQAWNAATVATSGAASIFVVAASNTRHSMTIALGDVAGPGTYPLGGSGPRVLNVAVRGPDGAATSEPTCCWNTNTPGATGSVVVQSSASGRLVGTFSFTIPPQAGSGATAPLVITNGVFDLGVDG
ncbi:MAG: hypothetical protein EA350_12280 [Gemmatimonadales bacterium]|nr:MAG: hypothetical protein EA350_12280 [Gemmatimonadales bacterium]